MLFTKKKQLNGERAYFGSQFKDIIHQDREVTGAGGIQSQ